MAIILPNFFCPADDFSKWPKSKDEHDEDGKPAVTAAPKLRGRDGMVPRLPSLDELEALPDLSTRKLVA